MKKEKILLSLLCIGMLVSCSDVSTGGSEHLNGTKMEQCSSGDSNNSNNMMESNVTEESKRLKVELEKLENTQKKLEILSSLNENSFKNSNKKLLEALQKIKWDKEVFSEEFELQKIKDEKRNYEEKQRQQKELDSWTHKASIAEAKAKELETQTLFEEAALESKKNRLESEIALIKIKKEREGYIRPEDAYLDNPLSEDNQTLIISDRRIELNGEIGYEMAESITNQINYLNNKNSKKPIFIVISSSRGGSIMAGQSILRAMDSSKAPIYVVLESLAASMAAVIVTLADKSFAYPYAVMLHHQPMFYSRGLTNLTEEKEKYEALKKIWTTFGAEVAKKMGITSDEFIALMYKNSSHGDWQEFATEAVELKWVNHVVKKMEDKSVLVDPLLKKEESDSLFSFFGKKVEENGKEFAYLPRLRPTDAYFIYNPDGYYKVR